RRRRRSRRALPRTPDPGLGGGLGRRATAERRTVPVGLLRPHRLSCAARPRRTRGARCARHPRAATARDDAERGAALGDVLALRRRRLGRPVRCGLSGLTAGGSDMSRSVRFGLHGTAMRAWDGVPEPNLLAIIQYLKTFSERWKDEEPGEPIVPTPDPWQGKDAAAVDRGRAVYHGLAQCLGCHPAFAP